MSGNHTSLKRAARALMQQDPTLTYSQARARVTASRAAATTPGPQSSAPAPTPVQGVTLEGIAARMTADEILTAVRTLAELYDYGACDRYSEHLSSLQCEVAAKTLTLRRAEDGDDDSDADDRHCYSCGNDYPFAFSDSCPSCLGESNIMVPQECPDCGDGTDLVYVGPRDATASDWYCGACWAEFTTDTDKQPQTYETCPVCARNDDPLSECEDCNYAICAACWDEHGCPIDHEQVERDRADERAVEE